MMATAATPLLLSITSFIEQHSQWALLTMFVLLTLESFGLPVPGETALIACSVLASQGALSIGWLVAIESAGVDRRRQPRLLGRAQRRTAAPRTTGRRRASAHRLPPPRVRELFSRSCRGRRKGP
jgi:hypothetical protein